MRSLAKEKDLLEREKWDLRRQTKEAMEHAGLLRSQIDMKENRIKELEAELTMVGHTHTPFNLFCAERHDRERQRGEGHCCS